MLAGAGLVGVLNVHFEWTNQRFHYNFLWLDGFGNINNIGQATFEGKVIMFSA